MDPRVEKLKQIVGIKDIPKGAHVTFTGENFGNSYPDFVKDVLSKIRVQLNPISPEFQGGQITFFNGVFRKTKFEPKESNYTYVVRNQDLFHALREYPEVAEWFKKNLPPDTDRIVFTNEQVESISE